jgi:phosphate-selective porin OprO/OprP
VVDALPRAPDVSGETMKGRPSLPVLVLLTVIAVPGSALAQASPESATAGGHSGTLTDNMQAGEAEAEKPPRPLPWNAFDGKFTTLELGFGLLYDASTYIQNQASKDQIELTPGSDFRDFRILLKGKLKTERPITWSLGYMYDGDSQTWHFRQTGIMVAVPELWGHFFVGRQKEGISLEKVMVGYAGWTMERQPMSDATLPILADGVKWLGYLPKAGLLWNLGVYGDALSEGEKFSTYSTQAAGRLAYLPLRSEKTGQLLHVGLGARYGLPKNGQLQLRSRPEDSVAPYVIDTGKFPASETWTVVPEVYYRTGPYVLGAEYIMQKVSSPQTHNPFFQGGELTAAWLITGETRAYNTQGGYFLAVSPARPVFSGGPGAWEAVLRATYTDLDSGTLHGGTFARVTPMINWHLSDNVRVELEYGYGLLNRFGLLGGIHFFQTRLQLSL